MTQEVSISEHLHVPALGGAGGEGGGRGSLTLPHLGLIPNPCNWYCLYLQLRLSLVSSRNRAEANRLSYCFQLCSIYFQMTVRETDVSQAPQCLTHQPTLRAFWGPRLELTMLPLHLAQAASFQQTDCDINHTLVLMEFLTSGLPALGFESCRDYPFAAQPDLEVFAKVSLWVKLPIRVKVG